ncbi:MAG: hypothetical protein UIQ62_00105 [Monoglobus pectinilyticus]|nr:hypothetical protein [Monoglobus pectinilyticus]
MQTSLSVTSVRILSQEPQTVTSVRRLVQASPSDNSVGRLIRTLLSARLASFYRF